MNGLKQILIAYLKLRREVELSRWCTEKEYGLLALNEALKLTPEDEEVLKRVLTPGLNEEATIDAIALLEKQAGDDITSVSEVMGLE